jgi:hypothetical protein
MNVAMVRKEYVELPMGSTAQSLSLSPPSFPLSSGGGREVQVPGGWRDAGDDVRACRHVAPRVEYQQPLPSLILRRGP